MIEISAEEKLNIINQITNAINDSYSHGRRDTLAWTFVMNILLPMAKGWFIQPLHRTNLHKLLKDKGLLYLLNPLMERNPTLVPIGILPKRNS